MWPFHLAQPLLGDAGKVERCKKAKLQAWRDLAGQARGAQQSLAGLAEMQERVQPDAVWREGLGTYNYDTPPVYRAHVLVCTVKEVRSTRLLNSLLRAVLRGLRAPLLALGARCKGPQPRPEA